MNRKLDRAMRFLKCLIVLVLLMSTCFISVSQVSATGSIYNTSNDIEFSKKDTNGLREYEGKIKFDLPAAQTSKGNDIIFLRDTSGSFSAHTRQLTEAISEIAEEVDLSQDRIMVINTTPATRASVTVPLTNDLKVIKDGLTRTAASNVTTDSGFEYALTNYNGFKGNTDNNTIFILISDNDAYGVQRTVDGATKVKNAGYKVGGIYIGSSATSIANGKQMVSDPSYFYQFTNMTQGIDALRELTQTMYETEDAQMEWTLDDAFELLDVSATDQDGKEIPVQVSGNTVTLVTPQDADKSVTLQYSFKEKNAF
ncbi:VWA domain-containing protein [Listeria rocourtiae]|uniref:VWA domain-containing protein n=1 Tax=Listeria rocourtiae TaxID=647910 RepID=UPI001629F8C5|nr:vWA domain-containing protein [Listeria rocourtiae]MBC1435128.1 VWA domain-containing protein [Listeria rocourtiae]